MTRPCWFIGLALLVGCLAGAWLPSNVLLMVAIGSVVVTAVSVAVPILRHRRGLFLSCLGMCAALIALCIAQFGHYLPLSQRIGDTVTFTATVSESDRGVYLTVTKGDLPKGTKLQLWNYDDSLSLEPYDVLEGTFTLCDYGEGSLAQLRRKANGAWFAVCPETVNVTAGKRPWTSALSELRHRATKHIESYLSGDIGALVAGICLGEDVNLSEQAENAFRSCGISHLFSVSGFHMALLSQALLWVLERFRASRHLRATITTVAILFFMMLVGTSPSVVRSGVLCLLMLMGGCFRRQADTRNSLGLALVLLLIADPFAAYDAGLLLSFFATFGLVIVCPCLTSLGRSFFPRGARERFLRFSKVYDALISGVGVTLSATLATAPIAILYFGELSVVSVVSNLLVSIPSSLLLIFGLAGCLCSLPFLSAFSSLFFFCAGWIARYLLWIGEKISNFPLVTVAIRAPYLLLWVIGMTVLLFVGHRIARRRGVAIVAVTGVITLLMATTANTLLMRGVTSVTAVATKGDTAVYIQSGEHTAVICAPTRVDTLYRLRTALRLDGVQQVDVLIVLSGDASVLLSMPTFLEPYLSEETRVYGVSETALDDRFATVNSLTEESIPLWDGVSFRAYERHGHLAIQQTDMLIVPDATTVHAFPKELWMSELVVFGEEIPRDALFLQGQWGVAQGQPYVLPSTASCGVEHLLTITDDRVTFLTRGAGDITQGDYAS